MTTNTDFMKGASTENTSIRFRSTGICPVNTDVVSQKKFLPSDLEVLNVKIRARE
jgi:hypothetical protein